MEYHVVESPALDQLSVYRIGIMLSEKKGIVMFIEILKMADELGMRTAERFQNSDFSSLAHSQCELPRLR